MLKKIILNIGFCVAAVASQAQATLPAFWSFVTPSPTGASTSSPSAPPTTYIDKAGWTTKLDVSVTGTTPFVYATGSDGNASCRLDGTNEFVQVYIADKPGPLSYYIRGTGIGTPSFTGVFNIQESPDGVNWTNLRSFTTSTPLTGTFTKFVDNPNVLSRYFRFFYNTKESGTNVALDSIYIKAAPFANTPTIQVNRNNIQIANNTQNVIGNNSTFTFKVKNLGLTDTLILDSVNFTGLNANSYAVTNTFPIKVAPKDSTNINCTLNTSGNGSRFSNINIYNNDIDKKQFIVKLYGIAGSFASEPLFKPIALSFSNITAFGMNVTLSDTSSTTEKYIVLRKRNGTITETPIDGQTYQRGDYIGAAQVAYVGNIGTFKPTYVLANNSYSYAAFAFNGPATYENYLTDNFTSSTVQSLAGNAGTYYSTINPSSPTFLTNLSAKINVHDTIFYGNYTATLINNFLTRDTSEGKKVVNCVYTGIPYIYSEPFVWNVSGGSGILTREHTRAQSTMPSNDGSGSSWQDRFGSELPEYNDQHNLFPAHQTLANVVRSNNPFGECVTVTSTSPSGFGKLGKDANGNTVYEPKDTQKGDLARALFYMSVCYNGIRGYDWSLPANQDLAVLMKWHQQDPPSAEEIARHEYIASIQKNRNPFIDNPSWANLIDFKTMTLNQGAVLTVSTPNGGENLLAGKTTNITWVASNITGKVKLEYTTNGTDFIFIDSVNVTPASYTWSVPAIATTTAKVRISTTNNSITDLSNANFTINVASLKLLTPLATDIWKETEIKPITWQSTFVDSVLIELKRETVTLWTKKELASKGSVSLTVPYANTTNAKVFISEINGNLKDSSAAFTIQPSIGINEAANFNFTVYPNPSNGTIYFNSNINLQNSTFEIYDITGKLYVSDSFSKTNMVTIPNKGVYILKANINGKTLVKKVIVE